MRRVPARTPPVPEPGSRSRHAAAPCCTTRHGNAHRTGIAEEREVLYPWHPWAGCVVHVHQAFEKVDGTILRCSRVGGGPGLELPAWMFDRSICLAMRIVRDPYVEFAALRVLRELLANVDSEHGLCLSSNTPVSGAVSAARDQNRGNAHATAQSTSGDRPRTSPAARVVRFAGPEARRSAGAGLASTAGRDTSGGDEADGSAPARSHPCRSASDPDGGGR